MAEEKSREPKIPVSVMAQMAGWILGVLWVGSEQVRDVAYIKDSLILEVSPAIQEAEQERIAIRSDISELTLVHTKDKEAIWIELANLRREIERLEDKLHQMKP